MDQNPGGQDSNNMGSNEYMTGEQQQSLSSFLPNAQNYYDINELMDLSEFPQMDWDNIDPDFTLPQSFVARNDPLHGENYEPRAPIDPTSGNGTQRSEEVQLADFQAPIQQQQPQYPSDDYDPRIGWWVPALPHQEGALFNVRIGWYFVAAPPTILPPSEVSSAVPSSAATPILGPAPPYGNFDVPRLAGTPIAGPPNTYGMMSEVPRLAAAPRAPRRSRVPHPRGQAATSAAKRSIIQACICKDKSTEHVRRPRNAFILFRSASAAEIIRELSNNRLTKTHNQTVSQVAGDRWNNAPAAVKEYYQALAGKEKREHAIANPGYQYKPGSKNASRFGTSGCMCGAYEANMKHNNLMPDDVDDFAAAEDVGHRPIKRVRSAAPQVDQEVPLDEYNPFFNGPPESHGTTPAQQAFTQQAPNQQGNAGKRKRTEQHESPEPARRSRRATGGQKSYKEDDDEDEEHVGENIIVASPRLNLPKRIRPSPITTSSPAPQQYQVYKSPPAPTATQVSAPATNTRSKSSGPSQKSPTSAEMREFFNLSPARSTRSKTSQASKGSGAGFGSSLEMGFI